jgi:serpin B
MFLQHGFTPAASFLVGLHRHFGSTAPQSVDFRQPSAVEAINAWVSAHTQGVIPRVLTELPPQTLLALVNAIYLKAAWLHPFKPAATVSAPFHGEGGTSSVAFMNQTDELPYSHGKGYAAVDLPYLGSTLSLLVVLPVGESVATLQRRLDPGGLGRIVTGVSSRPVQLSMPRFHLATHTLLNSTLTALGMTDAFDDLADFRRITSAVAVVDHAADFTVDEHGTVAAAATVVTAEPVSAPAFRHPPVPFDADRPFLFFLRDDHNGAVLFAGRMTEPASAPAQP